MVLLYMSGSKDFVVLNNFFFLLEVVNNKTNINMYKSIWPSEDHSHTRLFKSNERNKRGCMREYFAVTQAKYTITLICCVKAKYKICNF